MKKQNELRTIYETIKMVRDALAEEGKKIPREWLHAQRERIAEINRGRVDPLAKPLTEEFRVLYDEEGGYKEYAVLAEDGPTSDDEIEDFIKYHVLLPEINSPYDCTGQHFTRWVYWKRKPAGIVIIHSVGLDI